MGEISNKTLAVLVLAALVVVVVATTIQLNQLSDLGITGQATDSDNYGYVQLDIADALAIEVDSGYTTINFGTCTPNSSGTIIVDSNDTHADVNCTNDGALPQRIQINNIGNVAAEINLTGECTPAAWLPSSIGSDFEIAFVPTADCSGTLQTSYITLSDSYISGCTVLDIGGSINMSARATIPLDTTSAGTCGGNQQNDITFLGWANV